MESSKLCVDTVHVPYEGMGKLCHKPHFSGKVKSKSRLNFHLAGFMFLLWLSSSWYLKDILTESFDLSLVSSSRQGASGAVA